MANRVWRWCAPLVVLALFATPLAPHAAAAPPGELVLEGSRTASVAVQLRARTQYRLTDLVVTSRSRFAGFYAERIDIPTTKRFDADAHAGAVRLRDFHASDATTSRTVDLGSCWPCTLSPGRYRFYLIADSPTTVRLPWTGSPSLRLMPRTPAYAAAAVRTDILTSPIQAGNRQHLIVKGPRNVTMSSVAFGRFRVFAGQFWACIAPPEGGCEHGSDSGMTGLMEPILQEYSMQFTVNYEPGMIKPGSHDAFQGVTNATTLQFATAAAFTLALS